MIVCKNWIWRSAAIALLAPLAAAPQAQKSNWRDADQKELTNHILSIQEIRKLGEAEKAIWQIFDKGENTHMRDAWNDHGPGALASIAQAVQITEKEFPQIAAAIHKAGLSTREYVVVLVTLEQVQGARYAKKSQNTPYPPYVNPANIAFMEQHEDEVRKIMNPPRNDGANE